MNDLELASLFSTESEFDLCDRTFCSCATRFGDRLDASTEPEPSRTITLVWHSMGIIFNGGFHYLLEGNFNGDPGFVYTAASYHRIGAHTAYSTFLKALCLFPHNNPPEDVTRRLEIYESVSLEITDAIDSRFFDSEMEIQACLAKFIRDNESALRVLLGDGI